MKITLIHPSRNRPKEAFAAAVNWLSKADNLPNIQYILSLDEDDKSSEDYHQLFTGNIQYNMSCIALTHHNRSAIDAINNAAYKATGDLIIVMSDDFDCPEHWDTLLLQVVDGKSDFLLKTQDGIQKTLVTLPIMDRAYYSRFGYIYHPDYLHMHCDEEMTIVALMLGRYIKSDLLFEHLHYSTGKSEKDDINVRNDQTWAHGQSTLERRSQNNFGIERPLIKREDIVWK